MTISWTKTTAIAALMLVSLAAFADKVKVYKGTDVPLVFEQAVSSMTAKVGQTVKFRVKDDVTADGKVFLKKGKIVMGTITKVRGHGKFGKNAQIQITLEKGTKSTGGTLIPLEPKFHGKEFGKRTDQAAIASGAGAIVLGPVGLVGGYFINGKKVQVKKGDTFVTEVAKDMTVKVK